MLVDCDTSPPKGRNAAECEALLRHFYNFCQPWEDMALKAFLMKNHQLPLDKQKIIDILSHPEEVYGNPHEEAYKKVYYGVLIEIFILEGNTLEDGIRAKVGKFWEGFSVDKACTEEQDTEFYRLL
jgi:hypothetical protein